MLVQKSILVVCLNPAFEISILLNSFYENEVNRSSNYCTYASGKGVNVTRVLTQLGAKAIAFTHLGGERKVEFIKLCNLEKIDVKYFEVESEIRSCVNIVNLEKKSSTEIVEESMSVEKDANSKALALFKSVFCDFDAIVITGTLASGYDEKLYSQFVKLAKENNKLVVLDIKGKQLKSCLTYHPDVIKPNLSEFIATFEKDKIVFEQENTDYLVEKVFALTKQLYESYGVKSVISRGKFDTWVYDGNNFLSLPTKKGEVINTIGCGDALNAGMTKKLVEGEKLENAVLFGMDCALKNAKLFSLGIKNN